MQIIWILRLFLNTASWLFNKKPKNFHLYDSDCSKFFKKMPKLIPLTKKQTKIKRYFISDSWVVTADLPNPEKMNQRLATADDLLMTTLGSHFDTEEEKEFYDRAYGTLLFDNNYQLKHHINQYGDAAVIEEAIPCPGGNLKPRSRMTNVEALCLCTITSYLNSRGLQSGKEVFNKTFKKQKAYILTLIPTPMNLYEYYVAYFILSQNVGGLLGKWYRLMYDLTKKMVKGRL